jgi:hypothetical protein
VERRGPAVCNGSNNTGGKGEMRKARIGPSVKRRSQQKQSLPTSTPRSSLQGDLNEASAARAASFKSPSHKEYSSGTRNSRSVRPNVELNRRQIHLKQFAAAPKQAIEGSATANIGGWERPYLSLGLPSEQIRRRMPGSGGGRWLIRFHLLWH